MAYVYLLDLYKQIESRIANAEEGLVKPGVDEMTANFEKGRIDALTDFQNFLRDNFNAKLPRRIRENLERKQQ